MMEGFVQAQGALIPAIGLGTWQSEDQDGYRAVRWALEAGYRHIDTAVRYGNEAIVGQALADSGLARRDYFVTTKVWHTHLADGTLQESARQSVSRLGLDQVDLLLVHWPNRDIPLAETLAALCDAKRRGLTRHVGVANFPSGLLRQAVALSEEPIVANQCEYHPFLDQSVLLDTCRELDVVLIAYSPLGTGALLQEPVLQQLAEKYGKTVAQILLRWCIQQPQVAAIPKSANRERIRQNINVFDFSLAPADMKLLYGLRRASGRLLNPEWAPEWDQVQ